MKQVFFKCTSCEDRNSSMLGMDGYIIQQTEFESFTDAWNHMMANHNYTHHEIIAFIQEETND